MHSFSEFVKDTPFSIATWNTSALSYQHHRPRRTSHPEAHLPRTLTLDYRSWDLSGVPRLARGFGAAADVPRLQGHLLPEDADAATSRAGGLVFAISRELMAHAPLEEALCCIRKGRAATLSLRLGGWVHFTGMHIDPTLPMSAKRRLLADVATHLSGHSGIKFLLGGVLFCCRRRDEV